MRPQVDQDGAAEMPAGEPGLQGWSFGMRRGYPGRSWTLGVGMGERGGWRPLLSLASPGAVGARPALMGCLRGLGPVSAERTHPGRRGTRPGSPETQNGGLPITLRTQQWVGGPGDGVPGAALAGQGCQGSRTVVVRRRDPGWGPRGMGAPGLGSWGRGVDIGDPGARPTCWRAREIQVLSSSPRRGPWFF